MDTMVTEPIKEAASAKTKIKVNEPVEIDLSVVQPINQPVSARVYRLHEQYRFTWYFGNKFRRIVIDEGFLYDGASIPRFFWGLAGMRPDGLVRAAATVHDFIFYHRGKVPKGGYQTSDDGHHWTDDETPWDLKHTDLLFGRVMRDSGMPKIRRRLMFLGVKMASWYIWQYKKPVDHSKTVS